MIKIIFMLLTSCTFTTTEPEVINEIYGIRQDIASLQHSLWYHMVHNGELSDGDVEYLKDLDVNQEMSRCRMARTLCLQSVTQRSETIVLPPKGAK